MHHSSSVGSVAGAPAGAGRVNALPATRPLGGPPLLRLTSRESCPAILTEREIIDHVAEVYQQAGLAIPRSLLVNYYVALKSNPFVVLAGAEGTGKADFIRLFAQAILGVESAQYTLAAGHSSWHSGTGEGSYYRGVHDRFTSMRFLELLGEAAAPVNSSKLYFVSFQRLHPSEIHTYFSDLLRVDANGCKRLHLPGAPADRLPLVPPNVFITATVDTHDDPATLDQIALRHAGLIVFQAATQRVSTRPVPIQPLPVGYQRLLMQTAITDLGVAQARLHEVIGNAVERMRPSPEVGRLLWRDGRALTSRQLNDLTIFVANSFDVDGSGLFHQEPHRNAQIAYDAQVIQRVLWRSQHSGGEQIQRDLAEHLERLSRPQQAVA
ncbi:MAG TPA: hypothetical protein VFT99_25470 [Roseiflexaceae bacterium]|nr:hypothetical protein [Roseiflexaceae bacterium]